MGYWRWLWENIRTKNKELLRQACDFVGRPDAEWIVGFTVGFICFLFGLLEPYWLLGLIPAFLLVTHADYRGQEQDC